MGDFFEPNLQAAMIERRSEDCQPLPRKLLIARAFEAARGSDQREQLRLIDWQLIVLLSGRDGAAGTRFDKA
jgi:hypothetical protein